jgi:hypothetical protein
MVNFDAPNTISDFELAEFMLTGLLFKLKTLVNNFQLLHVSPFKFNKFKQRVQLFYKGLKKPPASTSLSRPANQHSNSSPVTRLSRDKSVWEVHAFLDSQGRCHYCKKNCGSASRACPGPLDRLFIEIPLSFQTPPKPPN